MITVKIAQHQRPDGQSYATQDSFGFRDHWLSNSTYPEAIVEVASSYQSGNGLLIQIPREEEFFDIVSDPALIEFQRAKHLGLAFINPREFAGMRRKLGNYMDLDFQYSRTRNYQFRHILPDFPQTIKVWTDGSHNSKSNKIGWAWVSEDGQGSGSVITRRKDATFQAEHEALRQALHSHPTKTVTLYTDCRAVIQKFEAGNRIADEFESHSYKLVWVKGHNSLDYNVIADFLAGVAAR